MINLREWALPVYTIMMQMAAGTMLVLWLVYTQTLRVYGRRIADKITRNLLIIILATVAVAMIGSHYHLSRPMFSIFAMMNFKSSWLSREVTFTIVFTALVGGLLLLQGLQRGTMRHRMILGWGATAMGIATVYAMAHVYLVPTQTAWNTAATPVAFFSTLFLLGSLAVLALLMMNLYMAELRDDPDLDTLREATLRIMGWVVIVIIAAVGMILVNYAFQIMGLRQGDVTAQASLGLMLGLYGPLFAIRLGLLGFSTLVLVGAALWQRGDNKPLVNLLTTLYVVFAAGLISEVLGRFLFYAIHVRIGI